MSILLSHHLREGTRRVHAEAESVSFIRDLMEGRLSIDDYARLAAQQYFIYRALEELEAPAELDFPQLKRVPSIEKDLAYLYGPEWPIDIVALPATLEYVERIAAVDDVATYAAHAYTRYLGDLSGGRIIHRMMQRHYGMGDEGLNFYVFEQIDKAKPFKDLYRERLDSLSLDEVQIEKAVDEAVVAFRLNQQLFSQLSPRVTVS